MLDVDDALQRLAAEDPQNAQLVKLRFFVGYTHDETAVLLGISEKTVRRQWKLAKAWLYQALKCMEGSPLQAEKNNAGP